MAPIRGKNNFAKGRAPTCFSYMKKCILVVVLDPSGPECERGGVDSKVLTAFLRYATSMTRGGQGVLCGGQCGEVVILKTEMQDDCKET